MKESRISRRSLLGSAASVSASVLACRTGVERIVILTFDDAVRSHRFFVAPFLADLGFSATFFVTHRWMDDRENFMSWDEIAEIDEMGFEIGNHTWSHADFSIPKNAARLEGELALVDNELAKVGVDRPVSFAWCGNRFGPEALHKLRDLGYLLARRGLTPELATNRTPEAGAAYDPRVMDTELEHFRRVLDRAVDGIVVLQFHGVPDITHPWVHTPPDRFCDFMAELRLRDFRVLALRDLVDRLRPGDVADEHAGLRVPERAAADLESSAERAQTRSALGRWTAAMVRHNYSATEATGVAGFSESELAAYERDLAVRLPDPVGSLDIVPYPGGRHPRAGFLEGAIDPLRGTKASVFLPWDPESYLVVDLPELITSHMGHLFLAHTHVPTIWTERNVWLDNVDWQPSGTGGLDLRWELPNGVVFESSIWPDRQGARMTLSLTNGLDETLAGLRTQLCVMLNGAPDFRSQTLDNKVFDPPVAAVRSDNGRRWSLVAWERAGRCWGNARCPCIHSDPVFPDCKPGQTVRLAGRLWFFEGESPDREILAAKREFPSLETI